MVVEKDESGISPDGVIRIQRPGLQTFVTVASPVRQVTIDPQTALTYIVAGSRFYTAATGSLVDVGSVGNGPDARIVVTALKTGILSAGAFYLFDGATVTNIPVPDGAFVTDIDQINGYFLLLLPSGRFYWLVPGETVIDPLNFATAESSNDSAYAIRQVGEEFWIFGSRTVEPWQPTGDLDLPFQRAQGRVMARGALPGRHECRFDNSIVWVGDDANVYRGGAVPQIISNPGISERIRLCYAANGNCTAWTFEVDGHAYYVLRITTQGTFVYDASTQLWSRWQTEGDTHWTPWVGDSLGGATFAGEHNGTRVFRVSPMYLMDVETAFTRLLTGSVPILGTPPRNDSLSIGVGATADTTVRIRWRDGQDDYPVDYYDELEVRAPFDICSMYRLGAPVPPYREVEISFVGPEGVRVAGCLANEAWQ